MKEKVVYGNLLQLAESVRLATPLARFGKVVRTASKQRVGSSNLPGRATSLIFCTEELTQVSFCLFRTAVEDQCRMLKPIIEIDGSRFDTLNGFWEEISVLLIPGASWGRN